MPKTANRARLKNARCGRTFAIVILLFNINTAAHAQGVYVEAGQKSGLGVLRARGEECFAITPYHVVEDAFTISIIGQHDMRFKAELLRELPGDLAVLRLIDPPSLRCDEWYPLRDFNRMLETQTKGYLVMHEADSSRTLMDVKIVAIDAEFVFIKPESDSDQISQRMSGASLRVNGALAGILLDVSYGEGRVYQLDDIMRVTQEYFSVVTPDSDAESLLASPSELLREMLSGQAESNSEATVTFQPSQGARFPAAWTVEPASLYAARSGQQRVDIEFSLDQGPFISAAAEHDGIIVRGAENAKEIGVRYNSDDPRLRGPFWYDVDFAEVARRFFKNRVLAEGGWVSCWEGNCVPTGIGQNAPAISRIRYGSSSEDLGKVMRVSVPDDFLGESFVHQSSYARFGVTPFEGTLRWDTVYVQLEFFDNSVSDIRRFATGTPYQTGVSAPEVTTCDQITQEVLSGGAAKQLSDMQKMFGKAAESAFGRMVNSVRASCAALGNVHKRWTADDCNSCITEEALKEVAQGSN